MSILDFVGHTWSLAYIFLLKNATTILSLPAVQKQTAGHSLPTRYRLSHVPYFIGFSLQCDFSHEEYSETRKGLSSLGIYRDPPWWAYSCAKKVKGDAEVILTLNIRLGFLPLSSRLLRAKHTLTASSHHKHVFSPNLSSHAISKVMWKNPSLSTVITQIGFLPN